MIPAGLVAATNAAAGAGSSSGLLGSLLGVFGGLFGDKKNRNFQREFAQNGISWKVADAKRAGIHPLYALGASTQMPSFGVGQTGRAIQDAGEKVAKSGMNKLLAKSVEADIVLKLARASEVAKRTQTMNSQQDSDVVKAGDLVQPGARATKTTKPLKQNTNLELRDSLEGLQVKTPR